MTGSALRTIGLEVNELPTPALILDLDVFDTNAAVLANHLAARGVGWRPHIKAHKSPVLAKRMIAAGAMGVTCAKVGEAEEMVAGGVDQVLLANQPGTADAWDRLGRLQQRAWVAVAIDDRRHVEAAQAAGRAHSVSIPLLIEVDIGMTRAGVRSVEAAVALAKHIESVGARFAGVMGYEGHLLTIEDAAEKKQAIETAVGTLIEVADSIRRASIAVDIVSCGGTGSYEISSEIAGVTEIQAGGGCLMDRFYREMCGVDLSSALFLVASVTSRPTPEHAIVDAGWKALADRILPPVVVSLEGAEVSQLYAEHMRVQLAAGVNPEIGERIMFMPGYSDATTVLHNEFLGVRNGIVVEVIPLAARGALS
jgi:D-serine deaminase-like pyridoxal phosphate-dependent protein